MFLTFCRAVFSENFTTSPSARNQAADSCGRPLAPIVPSTATCALSLGHRHRPEPDLLRRVDLGEAAHVGERLRVAGLEVDLEGVEQHGEHGEVSQAADDV